MSKVIATITTRRGAAAIDASAIAAKNEGARKALSQEINELLRIRRAADKEAFRLITLLDLNEPDPDLEPEEDEAGLDEGAEPSLGWTSTFNQGASAFHGQSWNYDAEAEHDGREPDFDNEEGPDMEDCAAQYHGGDDLGAGAAL